jgi:hypothetical protein
MAIGAAPQVLLQWLAGHWVWLPLSYGLQLELSDQCRYLMIVRRRSQCTGHHRGGCVKLCFVALGRATICLRFGAIQALAQHCYRGGRREGGGDESRRKACDCGITSVRLMVALEQKLYALTCENLRQPTTAHGCARLSRRNAAAGFQLYKHACYLSVTPDSCATQQAHTCRSQ